MKVTALGKTNDYYSIFKPELDLATRLLNQQVKDKNKIYALLQAPDHSI